MTITERANRYVDSLPPSISGSRGHDALLRAACTLTHGFSLSDGEAWPILVAFGARCLPPWSTTELKHKLNQSRAISHSQQSGHLLGGRTATTRTPDPAPRVLFRIKPASPAPAPAPEKDVSKIVHNDTQRYTGEKMLPMGDTPQSSPIGELPPEPEPTPPELSDFARAKGPAWIAFTRRQNARMIADGWERGEFFDLTDQADVEAFEKLYKRKL